MESIEVTPTNVFRQLPRGFFIKVGKQLKNDNRISQTINAHLYFNRTKKAWDVIFDFTTPD